MPEPVREPIYTIVDVTVEPQPGGRCNAYSNGLPGLILSGYRHKVEKAIGQAIAELSKHGGREVLRVTRATPMPAIFRFGNRVPTPLQSADFGPERRSYVVVLAP